MKISITQRGVCILTRKIQLNYTYLDLPYHGIVLKIMKRNPHSFKNMLKYEAKQFCLNTALHGYRFIVLPKRVPLERVIWITVIVISAVAAVTLLSIAWYTFQLNPTTLVTDSTHHPIWNYPFPAITVCSINKISKEKAFDVAKSLKKPQHVTNEELAHYFKILYQMFHQTNNNISIRDFNTLQDILDTNNLSVGNILQKLSPTCDEILQKCKWKGEEQRCESIFELIKTTEGYCCAFNYFALKNYTFSGALANKAPTSPRRLSACGYQTALEVIVKNNPNDYFATELPTVGHRVVIHNSYDFPDWPSQNIFIDTKIINLIGINPTITYSTAEIFDLDRNKRQCYFKDEINLHNFAQYTYHNCLLECRMNIIKKQCGCLPFYYAYEKGTFPETRECTLRDIPCLTSNIQSITSSFPGQVISNNKRKTIHPDCLCLPPCEYVLYLAESSAGILSRDYATNQMGFFGGIVLTNHSVFRVFFNDLVATKNRRDISFSWHTLLAYYGGILGLFLGYSFVSTIEIIYFFTIRFYADSSTSNKQNLSKKNNKHVYNKHKSNLPPVYETLDPKVLLEGNLAHFIRRRSNPNSVFVN